MNQAFEMIAALEREFDLRLGTYPIRWHTGIIAGADYHLAWRYGDRRLGDECRTHVLTVEAIEIAEEARGTGIVTEFIERMLTGDPTPRIPCRFLHFKECGPGLSRLLERLHFHRHPVGPSADYWHPVTGQKELPL